MAHHDIITNDRLVQAQATVGRHPDIDDFQPSTVEDCEKPFNFIYEFDYW